MWLETRVRMVPKVGNLVAGILAPMWVLMDVSSMVVMSLRRMLMRRWRDQLVRAIRAETGRPEIGCSGNAAGLGGQTFSPIAHVAWGALYTQCDSPELHRLSRHDRSAREFLFFSYFGPLEAWCEANCVGTFYLWTDDRGVNRVFTDPTDALLWSLTFNGAMPSMRELESLKTGS